MQKGKILMVGLPLSGKSSFIGPLWHIVDSKEINSIYSISVRPEDREYINNLKDNWLSYKVMDRTPTHTIKQIELLLTENGTGVAHNLFIPDMAGEIYRMLFQDRRISSDVENLFRSVQGIMLFIHPNSAETTVQISEIDEVAGPAQNHSTQILPWHPNLCPTQVILVDLLQMLYELNPNLVKIAVIVSAWDLIEDPLTDSNDLLPEIWLKNSMPLLFQYLSANDDDFRTEHFGISAQGADYENAKDRLADYLKQSDRIIVKSRSGKSSDITLPLKWLFDE